MLIDNIPISIRGRICKIASVQPEDEHFHPVENPKRILDLLEDVPSKPDLFSFIQRPIDPDPKYNYYYEWDNFAAIPITTYDKWFHDQVHSNVRNKIKKAFKSGIKTRIVEFNDELVAGMYEIFNESKIRQNRQFSHYGKSHEEIKKEWSKDFNRSIFLGAFLEDELVGFIKILFADRYARTSGTIAKIKHRKIAPMNALFDRCVAICAEKGMELLVYGKYSYGKKGPDSLSDFKKYNGFVEIKVPKYFIPLTIRGKLILMLNLQNGIKNLIPSKAYLKLVQLRNKVFEIQN